MNNENLKNGFITLFRSIEQHWIFDNAEYFKAFVTILFRVNFVDKQVLIGKDLIECKRGEALYSLQNWTKIFGINWTIAKTRNFFKLLEKDSMILQKGFQNTTRITVCNYDNYQDVQQAKNKQKTNESQANNKQTTSKKQQLNNGNNDNNDNQENKKDKPQAEHDSKIDFSIFSEDLILVVKKVKTYFAVELIENLTTKEKWNWCDEIRKLNEIDSYDLKTIEKVIIWGRTNEFWKKNFISIMSLRKTRDGTNKFAKMKSYMDNENKTSNSLNYKPKNEDYKDPDRLDLFAKLKN